MSQTPLPSYPAGNYPQPSNWGGPRDVNPRMKPEGQPVIGPLPPTSPTPPPAPAPLPRPMLYGAEAVRGQALPGHSGGFGGRQFDHGFLQNLAAFAAQNLARPNGNMTFNPVAAHPNEGGIDRYGTPLGGGNAPLMGIPQSLLSQALFKRFGT